MKIHLLPFFALLCVTIALNRSNGALPEEVYWKSNLPNTPLPKALQELLLPGNESRFADIKDIVESKQSVFNYVTGYGPISLAIKKNIATYNESTIFFLYNDLHRSKKMKLSFTNSIKESKFLPRKIADSIPFSSNKSQEILNYFSIDPASKEGQIIKQTIKECEAPRFRGEDKYCATSFESLVDFITSKLGSEVRALSNEVEESTKQEYTILTGIKIIKGDRLVCHKQRYKYAVFYCHKMSGTMAYMVPLLGNDGSKPKVIVVCHSDTSAWNPNHFAFYVLNVKPGGPPICHFLKSDTIVWVST
ncbi:BURP domain-containing protein 5-like [Mercurialis annua]|uniref:BURP domain-containing protein 5-like n=1 Tax=Mercurialis annua TaxID=3986 RepID=UPI002160140E|nr:BURP domain-containing protein 5-like [Mercurialis annua]